MRRQAVIGLAQADSAAGTATAAALARDPDWRWRSVAAEAFATCRARASLEALLADPDGRVVAQAVQGLTRIVPAADTALVARAREVAVLEAADEVDHGSLRASKNKGRRSVLDRRPHYIPRRDAKARPWRPAAAIRARSGRSPR